MAVLLAALFLLAGGPFASRDAKVTVLVFLRADCPVANRLAPEVNRVAAAFADQPVEFWLVYPDDAAETIERHRREYGYRLPALADRDRRWTRYAGASVTPEAAVFAGGRLLYRGRIDDSQAAIGVRRQRAARADLEQAIRRALAGSASRFHKAVGCAISPGV